MVILRLARAIYAWFFPFLNIWFVKNTNIDFWEWKTLLNALDFDLILYCFCNEIRKMCEQNRHQNSLLFRPDFFLCPSVRLRFSGMKFFCFLILSEKQFDAKKWRIVNIVLAKDCCSVEEMIAQRDWFILLCGGMQYILPSFDFFLVSCCKNVRFVV